MTIGNETIQLRLEDRTAWITLDRPPLNILDTSMMQALDAVLERALPKCDFLVFQGAGEKAFSAGAEIADHAPERVGKMLSAFHAVFRRLAVADCLRIAAVHGYCLGGGMELATFCDFVLATESAQFGQPEIKLGCFPPLALVTLPHLIGMRAAAHLILTGQQINAAEAGRLGLVTRVVPDAQLSVALDTLLEELQTLSPSVLQLTRKTLGRIHFADFAKQLEEVERVYLTELMQTHDAREGVRAFLEKRPPIWKGK
ncbi:MAG TPA: enoyl-CoA hydratase/isomerase family protein [Candidatus Acidoferrales bacterium]|nr:enoyl-CoA hydratase/isomerase family protein [Candidatus Acidoferrales bacterium]